MKMSNKEKYLLGILGAVLVGVLYYQFVYTPQVNRIEELKLSKAEKEQHYIEIMNTIATLDERKGKVKGLNQLIIDKSVSFYPEIIQENLILQIDKLLTDSGLKGTISFSPVSVGQVEIATPGVNPYYETTFDSIVEEYNYVFKDEIQEDQSEVTEDTEETITEGEVSQDSSETSTDVNEEADINPNNMATAQQIKVSLNFTGEYNALKQFIKLVNENERQIVISNISLSGQGEGQSVTGSMNLEFYALPKVGNNDKDYLKWLLNNTYGKNYPFSTAPAIGTTIEQLSNNENSYDFVMLAKPQSSDLPTVMLGQANDETNMSYIYSDNLEVEEVEIVLSEQNGKYYFKYKVDNTSYPLNYSGNGVEFTPVGEKIGLNILSTKRLSDEDKSGVNIKFVNNTNKAVEIIIENEDELRPRVAVNVEGKDVTITKK